MMLVEGECNVCASLAGNCDHVPGVEYDLRCWRLIVAVGAVDEVSVVPRPAQPMARIQRVEVALQVLNVALSPRGWKNGDRVQCDKCVVGCHGVIEGKAALAELWPTMGGYVATYRRDPCPP
jgi:hypothetical protein